MSSPNAPTILSHKSDLEEELGPYRLCLKETSEGHQVRNLHAIFVEWRKDAMFGAAMCVSL